MPANTANGYPYPLATEPVANGATAIQNLAQAVDTRLRASATVHGVIALSAANFGSITITFPANRFTAVPWVVVGTDAATMIAAAQNATVSGFTASVRTRDNANVTQSVNIYAIASVAG